MNEHNNTCINVGFAGMLTILFIALKLLDVISWSWLWVLSPLWVTYSIILVVAIIIAILE